MRLPFAHNFDKIMVLLSFSSSVTKDLSNSPSSCYPVRLFAIV
jgi:hypothetical protein